jgi:hypothetical protein
MCPETDHSGACDVLQRAKPRWVENRTKALGVTCPVLEGQEEYGACIPPVYDTYIGGIIGMCQMPGTLLR